MLRAGRHNNSVLLLLLFTAWVLSPFVVLLLTNVISKRWSVTSHVILYSLMLVLTVGSLICYSGTVSPWSKPAAVFLVVPMLSWLLIVIVFPIAKSQSRKQSHRSNNI